VEGNVHVRKIGAYFRVQMAVVLWDLFFMCHGNSVYKQKVVYF